jgi:lyso-ornithine lipid O-acyltransferase
MGAGFRFCYRFIGFLLISVYCFFDFVLRIWLRGHSHDIHYRTAWCHRWGSAFMRLFGVRCRVEGCFPTNGLLASNHLSYLDIVVYAACRRFVFVSKSEVKRWPVVGTLTRCAGTLYIDREQRGDVKRMAEAFKPVIDSGSIIVLFPEGTSTGGDRVLPFHSSLFEPAATHQWSVCPSWIGYDVPGGDASEDVAYWKDMTFLPHLCHLFTLKEIRATVRVGIPLPSGRNRKEMARELHEQVQSLASRLTGC